MSRASRAGALLVGLGAALVFGCEPAQSPGRLRELELPQGFVDQPVAGALPPGDLLVAGWALAPGGIEDVSIYADGRYVESAVLGFSRPDVAAAQPADPAAPTSGFQVLLASHRLPPGPVTLIVQARSRSGATRDLGVVPVIAPGPR